MLAPFAPSRKRTPDIPPTGHHAKDRERKLFYAHPGAGEFSPRSNVSILHVAPGFQGPTESQ